MKKSIRNLEFWFYFFLFCAVGPMVFVIFINNIFFIILYLGLVFSSLIIAWIIQKYIEVIVCNDCKAYKDGTRTCGHKTNDFCIEKYKESMV